MKIIANDLGDSLEKLFPVIKNLCETLYKNVIVLEFNGALLEITKNSAYDDIKISYFKYLNYPEFHKSQNPDEISKLKKKVSQLEGRIKRIEDRTGAQDRY